MRVLLLRTWVTNIGNGFIDLGARQVISRTYPDAEIVESSGFSSLLSSRRESEYEITSRLRRIVDSLKENRRSEFKDVSDLVDVDVAILPGCILDESGLEKFRSTLFNLRDRDIPLIFLGAGGYDYSEKTRDYVRNILSKIGPSALITRDDKAFEAYADQFDFAYEGIDCAFFVSESVHPSASDTEFVAFTFDKIEEPDLVTRKMIVRPHHNPFHRYNMNLQDTLSEIVSGSSRKSPFAERNAFISDQVGDYLFIYRNASVTHSDRVHACIPALAYGNKARFYFETPRARLFRKVLPNQNIHREPVQVVDERLKELREGQVEALRTALETALDN